MQIPKLKEIDTTARSSAYWNEFIAEFSQRTADIDQYNEGGDSIVSKVQGEKRIESIRTEIEESVAQAEEYLLLRGILAKESLESYPKEQLVFLAMKDYFEVSRDDHFKWFHLPYRIAQDRMTLTNERMRKDREKFGWITMLPNAFLADSGGFQSAVVRVQQRIAIVQAIEAIRMAGVENGGKLIDSLDKAPVPVPNDPFTDKPFSYQVTGDVAVLSSEFPEPAPVQIELRFAK